MNLQEEFAWRERIHAMYLEAERLYLEATTEDDKLQEYLRQKYAPQPVRFE